MHRLDLVAMGHSKPSYGKLSRVLEKIGDEAAWMQFAEEAAELSKACMKVARFIHGTNPVYADGVSVSSGNEDKLYRDVEEELADVMLCSSVTGTSVDWDLAIEKLDRWCTRLGVKEK